MQTHPENLIWIPEHRRIHQESDVGISPARGVTKLSQVLTRTRRILVYYCLTGYNALYMKRVIEAGYPIAFRTSEAEQLGQHLSHHHSVVLIGMKRVGISNFLRFFLNHEAIAEAYIRNG